MIKVKNSTFNPNIMNCRKIRILTTIDPFWDISFGQRSGEIFFLTFSTENVDIYGKKIICLWI